MKLMAKENIVFIEFFFFFFFFFCIMRNDGEIIINVVVPHSRCVFILRFLSCALLENNSYDDNSSIELFFLSGSL